MSGIGDASYAASESRASTGQEADNLDRATALTQEATDRAVRAVQAAAKHRELRPLGFCRWCEEQVAPGVLFCDEHCRDDWHMHKAAQARAGRG